MLADWILEGLLKYQVIGFIKQNKMEIIITRTTNKIELDIAQEHYGNVQGTYFTASLSDKKYKDCTIQFVQLQTNNEFYLMWQNKEVINKTLSGIMSYFIESFNDVHGLNLVTNESIIELRRCLEQFKCAYEGLNSVWSGSKHGDLLSEAYPFDISFDELNVVDWCNASLKKVNSLSIVEI
jgi:hypothetical protein